MPILHEIKCDGCSSSMLFQCIRDSIDEEDSSYVEYKCQSCGLHKTHRTKRVRRTEFDFGGRAHVPIWCDDVVLVEPAPHSILNRPEKLIATLTLCVIHLLWKDMSTKGHELVRQLTDVALRSKYLVQEDIVDENIVEEPSETDRQT